MERRPSFFIRYRRVIVIALALTMTMRVATAPKPADALLGIGDVTTIIGNIPQAIWNTIEKAAKYAEKVMATTSELRSVQIVNRFTTTLYNKLVTGLSTTAPGQQPLFLQKPGVFLQDVAGAAAGDFLDNFNQAAFGNTLDYGQGYSGDKLRYTISKLLGVSIGGPVAQCYSKCSDTYFIAKVDKSVDPSKITDPGASPPSGSNAHEQDMFYLRTALYDASKSAKGTPIHCYFVKENKDIPGTYKPWVYDPNGDIPDVKSEECQRRVSEAIMSEIQLANEDVKACSTACKNTNTVNNVAKGFTDYVATAPKAKASDLLKGNISTTDAAKILSDSLAGDNSDVALYLRALGGLYATVDQKQAGALLTLNADVIPRTSTVSGTVLTPKSAFANLFGVPFDQQKNQFWPSDKPLVVNAINLVTGFLSSPVGKALRTYFDSRCGLNPSACSGPSNPQSTIGQLLFGTNSISGVAANKIRLDLADFTAGNIDTNDIAVSSELTSAGLIDNNFQTAIDDTLTVQEAIDQHLLDAKTPFGFDRDGQQSKSGISYRAMQYLRKYRVVPVGWELAALYYQTHRSIAVTSGSGTDVQPFDLSLGYAITQFDMCGQDAAHDASAHYCVNGGKYGQSCKTNEDCTDNGTVGVCGPAAICAGGQNGGNSCTAQSQCPGSQCQMTFRASPYCGLVDPNWVLKAPKTFCRRQGSGEEVVTKQAVCDTNNVNRLTGDPIGPNEEAPAVDPGPPNCVKSVSNPFPDLVHWIIARNDNVCADVQSCLIQNPDGTCQAKAYGYCMQEKDTYQLNGTSCPAQFGGCTAYTDAEGQLTGYIAKTLDTSSCNADNAGCQWYCTNQVQGKWQCQNQPPADTVDRVLLTSKAKSCNESAAGCRQFIRVAPGTNLLRNSGFDIAQESAPGSTTMNFPGWTGQFVAESSTDTGVTSTNVYAVALGSGTINQSIDVGESLIGRTFTGSIRAKTTTACTMTLGLAAAGAPASVVTRSVLGDWQTYAISAPITSASGTTLTFSIAGCGDLMIDSAQLEEGASATTYADYGKVNTVYMNDTRRSCSVDDIGCQKWTPEVSGPSVGALIDPAKRCSEDAVGCQTLTMAPIDHVPQRAGGSANIVIPKAKSCSAADVGCEEYTNLDEVAKGGEGKAYFKTVKQCVKPGVIPQKTFYSWIGDAEKGYSLRADDFPTGSNDGPCVSLTIGNMVGTPTCNDAAEVSAEAAICNANTFNDKQNPNPDCSQYYDSNLNVYYRLRSHIASATADCHPYRNTIDNNDTIYYLAPSENESCSADVAGCRAFTGNTAQTSHQIFFDNFDQGIGNWLVKTGQPQSNVSSSSASVTAGGLSMLVKSGTIAFPPKALAGLLGDQKSYLLTFTAAAVGASNAGTITASLGTSSGQTYTSTQDFSGQAKATWNASANAPEWRQYSLSTSAVTGQVNTLGISVTGGDVYIDNLALTETSGQLYLVNTNIPMCQDSEVGCAAYTNESGQRETITSFARLCADEAIGCEAMIDTQNSATPFAQTVKDVTTPADSVTAVVNDSGAYCQSNEKGCSALGQPIFTSDQNIASYQTVYKINDPDQHDQILCQENATVHELWCQAYTTSNGTAAYFKDPKMRTCEFRQDNGGSGEWYLTGTKYLCPLAPPTPNGTALVGQPVGKSCSPVCLSGNREGKACVQDTDCPDSICQGTQINGAPGAFGMVYRNGGLVIGSCNGDADCAVPGQAASNKCIYLAGICPTEQNECTEYRDPLQPASCRPTCPLVQRGGDPVLVDQTCTETRCNGGPNVGLNCHSSADCGGAACVGILNTPVEDGQPGCESYTYIRSTIEDNSTECNGKIDTKTGCRAFYDTSNSALNYLP